jgi:hypothetical protein
VAAQQPVTVASDSQNYQPGDQVYVTVYVAQPPRTNADHIWVFVQQPNGVNNYFQILPMTGGTVTFTLAMDAPFGNYTIVAAWNYPAGDYVTSWFMVSSFPIPEFRVEFLVLLFALTALAYLLDGRKTSISTTTCSPPSTLTCVR